jgi:peptidoglycan/LPS O-acetylase OafA/YrhL
MKMKRMQFLDGIRGWGAFTVLIYHVFIDAFPLPGLSKEYLEKIFFLNGTLAVWLFFITSGFSLSIGFLQNCNRIILRNIALSRYVRLALPILFFSLIMWLIDQTQIIPPIMDRPEKFRGFFTQNFAFNSVFQFSLYDVFFHYLPEQSFIPPLWTMPIEISGSAVVLSLCAIFGTLKSRVGMFFVIFWAFFYLKLYYICAFCAGIFLRVFMHLIC